MLWWQGYDVTGGIAFVIRKKAMNAGSSLLYFCGARSWNDPSHIQAAISLLCQSIHKHAQQYDPKSDQIDDED